MSHRERPAPRGPAVHPPAPTGNGAPVAWDDLYDRLSPDQRTRLIDAAAEDVIAAEQVPPPPPAPPPHLLHRLLNGEGLDDLHSIKDADFDADLPDELDAPQRAAISLALRTPDIALVQARPGTAREIVVAAAVHIAVRRGERVLLIAATPASLDPVLELLADKPEVCPLRCVGRGESADLSPAAAACIFSAHTSRLTEQARQQARDRIAAAVEICRCRDAEAAIYDHLLDLAEQHLRLQSRRAELPALRDGIAAAAEALLDEPTDAGREHAAFLARSDADLAARQSDAARARLAVAELEQQLSGLRPLAAARAAGKWWTPTWWRARFAGDVPNRLAEIEAKHLQAETYATTIEEEVERIARDQSDLMAKHDSHQLARRQAEFDRRRIEFEDQAVALDREMTLVADKWRQALSRLPEGCPSPSASSPEAAAAARDGWGKHRDADRRSLENARAWADGLEPLMEALPGRLLEAVNLVAASPAALGADRHFGDNRRGLFDLVILLDAHALTDGELLAVARRARRWVLIGEPTKPEHSGSNGAKRSRSPGHGGFARLWNLLHCDPWRREGSRVVCRLRSIPDRRGRLDREPVADRPEVELRIHTPPGGAPELAEVAFPAGTSIGQAVEYVFAELGELPAPLGVVGRVTPLFASNGRHSPIHAILAAGVRAAIVDAPGGWDVLGVDFDPACWDRERAAGWVGRHLVRHGPGRTVRLNGPSAAPAGREREMIP